MIFIYFNIAVLFLYSLLRKCSFALVFLGVVLIVFWGIRYDFGNDYETYQMLFETLPAWNKIDFDNINTGHGRFEKGFLLLYFLFGMFGNCGFYLLIFFLTVLHILVVFRFINRYVAPENRLCSIFILLFNISILIVPWVALRQCLTCDFMLLACEALLDRKKLRFLLLGLLACAFHVSALLIFLVPFILKFHPKDSKKYSLFLFVAYFVLMCCNSLILGLFKKVFAYLPFAQRYLVYTSVIQETVSFSLYNILQLIFFSFVLYAYQKYYDDKEKRFFLTISLIYFFLKLFTIKNFEAIGRINNYLEFAFLVTVPLILCALSAQVKKLFFICVFVGFFVGRYYFYLTDEKTAEKNHYKTIFSIGENDL